MRAAGSTFSPLIGGLLCIWLVGCSPPPPPLDEPERVQTPHTLRGEGLGTTWTVRWLEGPAPGLAEEAVVSALSEVDAAMSTWRDDSELARIRAAEGPVEVSWETRHVVREALALARDSGGAFDPTVQPLVELWGFHGELPDAVPTQLELDAVMATVGWDKVRVTNTSVDSGGTALDLSAIAKGWAVDRVAAALVAEGASHFLVEVGGETRVAGEGPSGPWTVGIERPRTGAAPGTDIYAAVRPRNGAVATSGNYRSRVTIGGQSFGHTLDPRVGRPIESTVRSATVIAPDCLSADGLATALMVLGEPGLDLVEARPGVEAFLLVEQSGTLVERMTEGFARFRVD
jgi:thiamine biosynthesis lipoprotein